MAAVAIAAGGATHAFTPDAVGRVHLCGDGPTSIDDDGSAPSPAPAGVRAVSEAARTAVATGAALAYRHDPTGHVPDGVNDGLSPNGYKAPRSIVTSCLRIPEVAAVAAVPSVTAQAPSRNTHRNRISSIDCDPAVGRHRYLPARAAWASNGRRFKQARISPTSAVLAACARVDTDPGRNDLRLAGDGNGAPGRA